MAQSNEQLLDAIIEIAESIARANPDCAERAKQIVALVGEFDRPAAAAADVEDAIEAGTDGDLSDAQVRNVTSGVLRAMRDRPR